MKGLFEIVKILVLFVRVMRGKRPVPLYCRGEFVGTLIV